MRGRDLLIMEPSKPLVLDVNKMKTSMRLRLRMPPCLHQLPIEQRQVGILCMRRSELTLEEEVSAGAFADGNCCGTGHSSLLCNSNVAEGEKPRERGEERSRKEPRIL
jgi:hypothetical protein